MSDPGTGNGEPGTGIPDPGVLIPDLGSRIPDPGSRIPDPWYACVYSPPTPDRLSSRARLVELAQDFSPRFECHGDDLVSIDVSGLGRLLGVPRAIGEELRRSSEARGLHVQVALAATQTRRMVGA